MGIFKLFYVEQQHYRALTGIRGWAALWVLLYHAWVAVVPRRINLPLGDWTLDLTPFFSVGWAGVPIFFVLSGFLLAMPFAAWQAGDRERPALGRYFFRRVARVFPAYYVQLLLLLLLALVVDGKIPLNDLGAAWRHLLMLFMPPPLGTKPINLVWWTLPIEFSFYLVLPLLAFLLRPGRWWLLLATVVGAMLLWRSISVSLLPADVVLVSQMAYQLPGSLDSFGLGMLGAALYVNRTRLGLGQLSVFHLGAITISALLVVVAAMYWMHIQYLDYWTHSLIFYTWTPLFGTAIAALLFASVSGCRLANWLFGNRVMIFMGLISYSVYLWHYPAIGWLMKSDFILSYEGYQLPRLLGVLLLITVLLASLSYAFVERPMMRLRRGERR
ncbi:MAG TPA: acyltransferase [Guyparkeria sp.]|nr:acyltransferase [Guyparkeria sp.]